MNKKYISAMLCALCLGAASFSMDEKTNPEEINSKSICKTSFEKKIDKNSIYQLVGKRIRKKMHDFGDKINANESAKQLAQFTWNLIKDITEKEPRPIQGNNETNEGGQSFCMHPEFFYELLTKCEDKNVLEIGGAQGEHAILFALAGAKNVYLNELAKKEMGVFINLKKQIPQIFQNKFKCFNEDIFVTLPKLQKEGIIFDIIQMRNLLHFFGEQQEKEFFKNLKPMIKEGTFFYISTNGKSLLKKDNSDHTYFNHVLICARNKDDSNTGHIEEFFSMHHEYFNELKKGGYQNCLVYPEKNKNQWIWDKNNVMKTLEEKSTSPVWSEEKIAPEIEILLQETNPAFLFVNLSHTRLFSLQNLRSIFETQNFNPIISSSISLMGHATIGSEDDHNDFSGLLSQYKGESNPNNDN